MGLFGKKKQTEMPTGGFMFELLGDRRDNKLTPYQRESLEILAGMEVERELMRRCDEPIERRFYGVRVHIGRETDDEFMFETPMEGVELIRCFAGRDVQWFRLREDEGPERFTPFKGQPAKYQIKDKGEAGPSPLPALPILTRDKLPREARLAALVDVETTGLIPGDDGIVEFAGTLFAFHSETGRVLGQIDEYSSYHRPGIPISPEATREEPHHPEHDPGPPA